MSQHCARTHNLSFQQGLEIPSEEANETLDMELDSQNQKKRLSDPLAMVWLLATEKELDSEEREEQKLMPKV